MSGDNRDKVSHPRPAQPQATWPMQPVAIPSGKLNWCDVDIVKFRAKMSTFSLPNCGVIFLGKVANRNDLIVEQMITEKQPLGSHQYCQISIT